MSTRLVEQLQSNDALDVRNHVREVDDMRKQSIMFDSPLEALVAVAKRLSRYETEAGMDSADFFARYERGESDDDARSVDWANDYRHFLALHDYLEERLHEAA